MIDFLETKFFNEDGVLRRVFIYFFTLIPEMLIIHKVIGTDYLRTMTVVYLVILLFQSSIIKFIIYDGGIGIRLPLYVNPPIDSVYFAKLSFYFIVNLCIIFWNSLNSWGYINKLLDFQWYLLVIIISTVLIYMGCCHPVTSYKERKEEKRIAKVRYNVFELEKDKEQQLKVIRDIIALTANVLIENPPRVNKLEWLKLEKSISNLYDYIGAVDKITEKEIRDKVIECEVALLKVEYTAHLNIYKLLNSNPELNYKTITAEDIQDMINRYEPVTKDIKMVVDAANEADLVFLKKRDQELEDEAKLAIKNTLDFLG